MHAVINVDTTTTYQTMDGFGYTLTGGSAELISKMNAAARKTLLHELFGSGEASIGISVLRISIGASDLNAAVFSYDDVPAGQTDINLKHFSLGADTTALLPLLKEILAINPKIKILATPWSAPVWMKDNKSTIGGSLRRECYEVYARYLAKYLQHMGSEGIAIYAITPQNEPLNDKNNPSMLMPATQQTEFIRDHLGPLFESMAFATKIIVYDHNCDKPEYPLSILNNAAANRFVDGAAFHLYAGDIGALTTVHDAHPDKNIYFTEQYTGSDGSFGGDLKWHVSNLIIGATRNWSRTVLEWNLANDRSFGPHTPGGCTTCKGALTIDGSNVTRNTAYYIIAQASKFVPAGAVRIGSNTPDTIANVAFKTPEGRKVLIAINEGTVDKSFDIRFGDLWTTVALPAGAAGTFTWQEGR
jgi:glucosylceramidase